MFIEHVAIWTNDIERLKSFYVNFFNATSNEKYVNPDKGFESYFLEFDSGARLEIMQRVDISQARGPVEKQYLGITHIAFNLSSENEVDEMTELLRSNNVKVIDGPRRTGDGYYESVVLDPDGNRIELVG